MIIKYDPLESTRYITPFIASCEMNVDEILNLPDFSALLNFFLPAVLLRGETEDDRGPVVVLLSLDTLWKRRHIPSTLQNLKIA